MELKRETKAENERASYGQLFALLTIAWLLITVVGFILAWAINANALPRPIPAAFILRGLDVLPVYHLDRGPEHAGLKAQQMAEVSAAISEVAKDDRDLAALLVTVGQHESAWSLAIMNGRCPPKACDVDKNGVPRAHSNYQLWRVAVSSREAWEQARTDVKVATREAAYALRRARGVCRGVEGDPVRLTLRAFAGRACRKPLKDEEARMKTYAKVRAKW